MRRKACQKRVTIALALHGQITLLYLHLCFSCLVVCNHMMEGIGSDTGTLVVLDVDGLKYLFNMKKTKHTASANGSMSGLLG